MQREREGTNCGGGGVRIEVQLATCQAGRTLNEQSNTALDLWPGHERPPFCEVGQKGGLPV